MKIPALTCLFATAALTPALAADPRFIASLKHLDPQVRLEQICDYEAMNRIGHGNSGFSPDRAKSDVMSAPRHLGDLLVGTGGAFRSAGNWYRFSFKCQASPDHLKVLSFEYQVGSIIPESKWNSYGLWR
ncbi:DUF930 domain-containing protein [Bradyrhizobium sp. dw_78]|uniref:DUF930 domain-containing protein n=1 Tax=Bradyrhizobium sp. dw_78 TaxID=2719793 RepID=UPI001BD1C932|nr:DUF930 domain-containing protein [Bradyrhizobium sp. dw_78]